MQDEIHCEAHGKACKWKSSVPIDMDGSGSPCIGFSRIGQRLGENSEPVKHFLCYCRIMLEQRTRVIIHENAHEFPDWMLDEVFCNTHERHAIRCKPAHAGFGATARERRYDVLTLKGGVAVIGSIRRTYDALVKACDKIQTKIPDMFCEASDEDLKKERNSCVRFVEKTYSLQLGKIS